MLKLLRSPTLVQACQIIMRSGLKIITSTATILTKLPFHLTVLMKMKKTGDRLLRALLKGSQTTVLRSSLRKLLTTQAKQDVLNILVR